MNLKASKRIQRTLRRILDQLDRLLALAADEKQLKLSVPAVSAWSVGNHVEHLVLADFAVLDQWDRVEHGQQPSVRGGPTLVGRLCLLFGYIPRGKAQAMERIRPQDADPDDLVASLTGLRARLADFENDLAMHEMASWRAPHPVFGPLGPTQWLRFLDVHHRHHLRIVDDIQNAAAQ